MEKPSLLDQIKMWLAQQQAPAPAPSPTPNPWVGMQPSSNADKLDRSMKKAFKTPGQYETETLPTRVNGSY